MRDYNRLTKRDVVGTCVNIYEFANEVKKWQEQHGLYDYMGADATQILLERLADLEDKIENGTLVELPRMFQDLSKLGWYVEWLDETGCAIHCHFSNKAIAEAKLRELKGERE